MAAQRVCSEDVRVICDSVKIDAIDVDEPSATEAAMNFSNSPWSECLHAHNMSLDDFAMSLPEDRSYDLIFSNPPYFEDSLTAPDERKSTARHTSDGLSYRDIFEFAKERLTDDGRVSLVLPADQEAALCRYARMCGLHLFRILRVRTVPRKAPSRMIAEFSRHRCETVKEELLTIQNEGQYTQEYLSLTHEFYLFA
jgi:tRNA1Val (adenine37-N6)-methyltransferase